MAQPDESERRKRRDAEIRSQDEMIAEHLAQSYKSGELQSASSFGKPMPEAEGWAETPTEFRLPFKILKNAGMPPPEIELFRKRAQLREELAASKNQVDAIAIQAKLSELEQVIALRLEGMRSSGKL